MVDGLAVSGISEPRFLCSRFPACTHVSHDLCSECDVLVYVQDPGLVCARTIVFLSLGVVGRECSRRFIDDSSKLGELPAPAKSLAWLEQVGGRLQPGSYGLQVHMYTVLRALSCTVNIKTLHGPVQLLRRTRPGGDP